MDKKTLNTFLKIAVALGAFNGVEEMINNAYEHVPENIQEYFSNYRATLATKIITEINTRGELAEIKDIEKVELKDLIDFLTEYKFQN